MQEINQIKSTPSVQPTPTIQFSGHAPPYNPSFSKKKSPEENTITYLLDDLNRSEQLVHFDA